MPDPLPAFVEPLPVSREARPGLNEPTPGFADNAGCSGERMRVSHDDAAFSNDPPLRIARPAPAFVDPLRRIVGTPPGMADPPPALVETLAVSGEERPGLNEPTPGFGENAGWLDKELGASRERGSGWRSSC